jgi:proline dehydrogenase
LADSVYFTRFAADNRENLSKYMSLLNSLVVATLPYVPKAIVGAVSRRYIAGVSLNEAMTEISALNDRGYAATTDLLGEYISRLDEAERNRDLISEIFSAISSTGVNSSVSVKLSQMGLLLDQEACYENAKLLSQLAKDQGNRLTMDMEDATTVDRTLDIYFRLRSEGFDNIGMVSQAYLRRASDDIARLESDGGGEVRLCKGIYVESEDIAYKDRKEIQDNFMQLFEQLLAGSSFIGIATHDDVLLRRTAEIIRTRQISPERFEYQMLLGVREDLRDRIHADGFPLRVYVPFGEHWYAYSVRRLRENPELAGHVFRALFRPRASIHTNKTTN